MHGPACLLVFVSVRAAAAVDASSMNSVCGGQRLGAWKDGKGGSEREMWCAWCMAYMCVSLRHHYNRGERVLRLEDKDNENETEHEGNTRYVPCSTAEKAKPYANVTDSQYATCYEESMRRGYSRSERIHF
jgi:hypothetical protein